MKRVLWMAAVVAVGVAACTAVVQAGGAKGDKGKLEGTWKITKIKAFEKDEAPPAGKDMSATFKGDKVSLKGENKNEEATYSLDETKKPKQITILKGEGKEVLMKGIYQIDGDTLRIAPSLGKGGDSALPESFEKASVIVTFTRAK